MTTPSGGGGTSEGERLSPLNRAVPGTPLRIRQLTAPPEVASRLREVGLFEDQIVRLISSQASLICQVANTRLALSRDLAATIHVIPAAVAVAGIQHLVS
ncbi:MAG TPA: hypothetical protein DCM86_19110 [Verrucomicrobiales bacterium]|nr:hypothetical protein [Verrucomicrobiales bacterium]